MLYGGLEATKEGGDGVGPSKAGRGSKVMIVTDGSVLLVGLYDANVILHQIALVDSALRSSRVPRKGSGRLKRGVANVVADKAYDRRLFRQSTRPKGIKTSRPAAG